MRFLRTFATVGVVSLMATTAVVALPNSDSALGQATLEVDISHSNFSTVQLTDNILTRSRSEKLLLAQTQRFPLSGSKFTELGDHRRMETQIKISNNGRIDGVTRIWTDKKLIGFTGSVAVAITDRAGNVLYVTSPQRWGVDCKRCPGPSNRTQGWADTVPSNVLKQVGGYAIIHTTSPRDRWRDWLSTSKEAVTEIKGIYSQF
ncbi:MAG: hypothetical protein V7K98_08945 [Nostoc sp.]